MSLDLNNLTQAPIGRSKLKKLHRGLDSSLITIRHVQILKMIEKNEKGSSRVVRVTQLWCRQSLEGQEIDPVFHQLTTGKLSLCQTSSKWYFFQSGKDKAAKGEA